MSSLDGSPRYERRNFPLRSESSSSIHSSIAVVAIAVVDTVVTLTVGATLVTVATALTTIAVALSLRSTPAVVGAGSHCRSLAAVVDYHHNTIAADFIALHLHRIDGTAASSLLALAGCLRSTAATAAAASCFHRTLVDCLHSTADSHNTLGCHFNPTGLS